MAPQWIPKRKILFRYEASWDLNEECALVLKEAWLKPATCFRQSRAREIKKKLTFYQHSLLNWRKEISQQEHGLQRKKIVEIDKIQEQGNGDNMDMHVNLQKELQLMLAEEELKWN